MFTDIDLDKYEGVLIDLDDTIYAYTPCHFAAKGAMLNLFSEQMKVSLETSNAAYAAAREKVHQQLNGQAASHSRLLYAKYMLEDLFNRIDSNMALALEEKYWNVFLTKMEIAPEALSFLEDCKSKKKDVAIVTDLTTQIQLRKFIRLNLARWVKHMVTSEEAGVEKPASKPFEMALNKLQLTANQVVMVGDSLSKDKQGAENLGMDWFHPF